MHFQILDHSYFKNCLKSREPVNKGLHWYLYCNLGSRVVLPSLSEYREYMYHWILSPESCSLPTRCSLPHTSVSFLPARFAERATRRSRCSGLRAIAQRSSLNVEMELEGVVVPSALLETIRAVPELVEGSRTGPWPLRRTWALIGTNSAYLR